ncbi:hypothetical protein [Actinophytocola sp.]|uniref:hypothetical protein n=1 Tax=Actinophytocola sp. TaxID=1872138 RepID=UPI003D6C011B
MNAKLPKSSVLVEIPKCRMKASVTADRRIMFNLGWPHDETTLVFEHRKALRHFVRVANDILAAPSPDDHSTRDQSEIVSPPD